ncbi:T9SS type A sorting domain-containing protein [candidate division KSB1 bacterium]|nr:T9SS type A sorting domain-containing protein [candidate division KSB1 bacterium]
MENTRRKPMKGLLTWLFGSILLSGVLAQSPENELLFSTQHLDYGSIPVRAKTLQFVAIKNPHEHNIRITGISTDHSAYQVSIDSSQILPPVPPPLGSPVTQADWLEQPLTLKPDQSILLTITFIPQTIGSAPGELIISTENDNYAIQITGYGYEMWTTRWQISAHETEWFDQQNSIRGMAFAAQKGHLYIAGRNAIHCLDAETGKRVKEIALPKEIKESIPGRIVVTRKGKLIIGNIAPQNDSFVLYTYAHEDSQAVKIFEGKLKGRNGDALAVHNNGNDLEIYVSGLDNELVHVLRQTKEDTFFLLHSVALPTAGAAGYSISPAMDAEHCFITGPDQPLRYIRNDGTVLKEIDDHTGTTCSFFSIEKKNGHTRQFVALATGTRPGTQIIECLGTPGDSLCSLVHAVGAPTFAFAQGDNPLGIAQVLYDSQYHQLLEMVSNVGVAAFDMKSIEPDAIIPSGSIAGAVWSNHSQEPLTARLYLEDSPFEAFTDEAGKFRIQQVPIGNHIIVCNARDHFLVRDTLQVMADTTIIKNFHLDIKTYPPVRLTVQTRATEAHLSWNLQRPDTLIAYHDDEPASGWFQKQNRAYGVIFDLQQVPGATIEQLDFCHYSWQTQQGPYDYRVHLFDWQDSTLITSFQQVAQDAYAEPKWEYAIDLGSREWVPLLGVFIEPLSGTPDDAHPALSTDNSVPAVRGTSMLVMDIENPFDSVIDAVDQNPGMGDFLMDLWIDVPDQHQKAIKQPAPAMAFVASAARGETSERGLLSRDMQIVKMPHMQTERLTGFQLFRGINQERLERLAEVPADEQRFIDHSPVADTTLVYGISAIYDIGQSDTVVTPYHHPPLLPIGEARKDSDLDFVPDFLGNIVTVHGTITSPNFSPSRSNFFLQDSTAGINLFSEHHDLTASYELAAGDQVYITGQIAQVRGLTQMLLSDAAHFTLVSRGNPLPDTVQTSLSVLGESLESQLLYIPELRLVKPEAWPPEGQNGSLWVTDGQDTTILFIDRDTDLDGWSSPPDVFGLVALLAQYTQSAPADDGYELRPRSRADFIPVTAVQGDHAEPLAFLLMQNYPNPFNPHTVIRFMLPQKSPVELAVFDLLGRQVHRWSSPGLSAGAHELIFDATGLSSGSYFYRLTAGNFIQVRRMVIVK